MKKERHYNFTAPKGSDNIFIQFLMSEGIYEEVLYNIALDAPDRANKDELVRLQYFHGIQALSCAFVWNDEGTTRDAVEWNEINDRWAEYYVEHDDDEEAFEWFWNMVKRRRGLLD